MDEKDINTTETEKKTTQEKAEKKDSSKLKNEVKKLNDELAKSKASYDELNAKYLQMLAEYDNFRKRSQKEREQTYSAAYADALGEFLPMTDNLQRSLQYAGTENFAAGIQMIVNQFSETLKKLGIEEFGQRGDAFDPNIHNAVMTTTDETLGENTVAEVLQKGYKKGDRIIRHAMVKVAN